MTKQNRFYLLIAALSATMASSDATAACCDYCDSNLQDTWADLKNGGWYLGDSDLSEGDLCNVWDCGSAQDCGAVCGPEEANNGCMCVEVNEGLLANQICNGDSTCAAWLRDSSCGDDDPSGSDGYIGGSGGPSCSSGEWYNYSTNSCKTCESHYNASASSTGGSGDEYSCYIPKGRTFTDTKGTGSFVTNCYYTDD